MRYYWERVELTRSLIYDNVRYDIAVHDRKGDNTDKPVAIFSAPHYAEIFVRAANQAYQAATLDNMNSNISSR